MLYEATIALLSLMLFMWGAAVWASYREDESGKGFTSSEEEHPRSAA